MASCSDPGIWRTVSDLAVISTAGSAGIFVMIPLWYLGLQFSEFACRFIDKKVFRWNTKMCASKPLK